MAEDAEPPVDYLSVWDQKPTAAMRRDRATRTVRVVSDEWTDQRGMQVVRVRPFEGPGRMTIISVDSLKRRFTRRVTS